MWGSSIEGEEKERGFIRGNSFSLILRKAFFFPQLVVYIFSVFNFLLFPFVFLLLGGYKGVYPLIVRDYKGVYPTEEDAFPSSVVFFFLYFFVFWGL